MRQTTLPRRLAAVGGAVAVAVAGAMAMAPSAFAGTASVNYGSCTSNNTALAAAPPDYTSQVTLTPSATSGPVGTPVTITWHYSISTAPASGIPAANVTTAQAKLLVGGAASSTLVAGPSALFPATTVAPGATFQIPDFTTTFTPTAAGSYTFTPGDNEQDVPQFGVVIKCTALSSGVAATYTATNDAVQAGSSLLRPGATEAFTGTGWNAGESVTPSFKDSAGTVTTGTAVTATATGTLSGSIVIPAAAASGAGSLTLTGASANTVSTPVTVLGGPTLTAAPAAGGPGTSVTLTGTGYDPGSTVGISGVDATSGTPVAVGSPSALTADANGNISGTYTVPSALITGVASDELVGGTPSPTLRAMAAFAFASNSCTADAAGSPVPSTGTCSVKQSASTIVTGGPLQMSYSAGAVSFPGVTLNGKPQTTNGTLQQVNVQDFRGSDQGWTLNATLSDLAITAGPYVGGAPIPATDVSISAITCAGNPAGGTATYPSTPTAGVGGALNNTTAVSLCSQAGNTTPAVTGGDFLINGKLALAVPAYVLQGTYTGTITISLQ